MPAAYASMSSGFCSAGISSVKAGIAGTPAWLSSRSSHDGGIPSKASHIRRAEERVRYDALIFGGG